MKRSANLLALFSLASAFVPAAAAQTCAAASGIVPLGGGTVGSGGALALAVDGAPVIGAPFALRVESGARLASGVLILGAGGAPVPLVEFGAVLQTGAPLVVVGFASDDEGRSPALFPVASVPTSLCGVELVLQAALIDAAATGGAAFTPALRVTFGSPQGASIEEFPARRYALSATENDLQAMASGDFDQDGRPDVVALERTGGQFNVLLNQPGGGLAVAPSQLVGGLLDAIAVGDVDVDGRDDVVAVDGGPGKSLRLARGLGAGIFAPTVTLATGVAERDVEIADIDRDGRPDIAAFGVNSGNVVLLFGSPTTFGAPQTVFAGAQPGRLAIGDVSGDGLLDLVVSRPNAVTVLRNLTGRVFAAPVHLGVTTFIGYEPVLADVDADGVVDIAVPVWSFAATGIAILRGQGGGDFDPPAVIAGSYGSVAVADVSLDGIPDLVAGTGGTSPGVSVLTGLGGGAFASAVHHRMVFTQFLLRDFHGDGVPDVAAMVPGSKSVVVLAGDGQWGFRAPVDVVVYPTTSNAPQATRWSALGDLDGDGHADVVTVTQPLFQPASSPIAESRLIALLGQGDGTFVKTIDLATGVRAQEVQLGDVDGDGDLDAIVAVGGQDLGPVPPQVRVFLGAGDGTLSAGPTITLPPFTGSGAFTTVSGIDVGDVGARDGLDDFVVRVNAATVVYGATGGGSFAPFATLAGFAAYPRFGDLDSDGALDLVGVAGGVGPLTVALGTGTGFGPVQSTPTIGGGLRLGDIDGDGTLDALVGPSYPDMLVSSLLGAGDGTFAPVGTYPTEVADGFAASAALIDVDLDGALDAVVWTSAVGGNVAFLRGQGDGSFGAPTSFSPSMPAFHCVVGDLDGADSLDVLVAGEFTSGLQAAVRFMVLLGR